MRPVVSSIVALAIAIAPFAAMASPETSGHKPVAAKVMKHHKKATKVEKTEKVEKAEKAEKSDKGEKAEKPTIAQARHGKPGLKTVLHHAHGVEVGGAGHKEPKIDKGATVVHATMTTKVSHGKTSVLTQVQHKPADMPKLPNPNATKASKSGSEKGARKPAEKKNDEGSEKDGKPGRDEDFADLVARIRGKQVEPKADGKAKHHADGKNAPIPCTKDPIEIIRGPEIDTFQLTKCDGTIAPLAVEHLSVLIRPGSAARPTTPIAELAKKKGGELAPGVHRIDERLAMRIQTLVDHFAKPGFPVKLSVVSGYRPSSVGSMHATGRAIDFRIEGAKNEDVVAFCKTLTDTGCGFYPNSSFVHLDVRDPGAGHVSWIDASGPGETPRYVSTWPPHAPREAAHSIEPASAKEPIGKNCEEADDEHPGETAP